MSVRARVPPTALRTRPFTYPQGNRILRDVLHNQVRFGYFDAFPHHARRLGSNNRAHMTCFGRKHHGNRGATYGSKVGFATPLTACAEIHRRCDCPAGRNVGGCDAPTAMLYFSLEQRVEVVGVEPQRVAGWCEAIARRRTRPWATPVKEASG